MQCRLAVQAALAAHQVSARNLLPTAAAAVLEAVSTTAGLLVATLQELQQGELAEPQPHLSGVRSRNLAPLVGAVRLLVLRYQGTQLLALQLDLRRMQACRMWRFLALARLAAMQRILQGLQVELPPSIVQHLELVLLVARQTLQEAVVVVVVAPQTTAMTLLLALLPSPLQQ